MTLPDSGFTPEVVERLVRMTGGNLRLLTQVERVLSVNDTQIISVEIVEAARDSLVISQGTLRQIIQKTTTKTIPHAAVSRSFVNQERHPVSKFPKTLAVSTGGCNII